ncbi:hypothetical protein CL614_10030 [archaeon]|nr:hypothetical protein [archaeon]|tara:strand:- start:6480 stop:7400 length:921 start_codon:yes stop_codon:yes gene_type:complete
MKKIIYKDFEKAFNTKLSKKVIDEVSKVNFQYSELSILEKENVILDILKTLDDSKVKKSGPHRIDDWISGWNENNGEFNKTLSFSSLIPKYFGKLPYVRWNREFIKPKSKSFEYDMVRILQYWLFEKYFSEVDNVYEFGCGTGHNLFRVNEINSNASLYGLDWAVSSQQILKNISSKMDINIKDFNFNFFNIDKTFSINRNSAIFTFVSLEQIGSRYESFIQYLIEQKPKICLHIEPMGEYLDLKNLNDYLSLKYFEKRNYIKGLKNYLLKLSDMGEIEILQDQRSNIGSLFVDGYSIIAWKPKGV